MRRRARIVREVLTELLERVAGGILTAAAVFAIAVALAALAWAAWRTGVWLVGFVA